MYNIYTCTCIIRYTHICTIRYTCTLLYTDTVPDENINTSSKLIHSLEIPDKWLHFNMNWYTSNILWTGHLSKYIDR